MFGGAGARPSYGGNPFLLGHTGGAYAGGRYTDPGVRYKQAMGQGANALLGVLSAPGGDAPDGLHRRALRRSARDMAAAKADLEAEMSLTFTGYGPLSSRSDPATRAEAARLARKLGFGPLDSGRATSAWPPRARGSGSAARTSDAGGAVSSFGVGTPRWRFGMAENPYLSGQTPGGASSALSGRSTSPTMASYMQALDAAGRAAAARSRGWDFLYGDAGRGGSAGAETSSIWAHTGKARGPFEASPAMETGDGDPLFATLREGLAPREGEESDLEGDRGGRTKRGVSQRLLDRMRKNAGWEHLPEDAHALTPAQIDAIYYSEFYIAPQIPEAAEVPDVIRDSKVIEQLFDAGVLHGPTHAGRMLQTALDKYLNLNTPLWVWKTAPDGSKYKYYDGIVGSDTRDAIDRAIREGRIADVNDAMVENRIEFMRNIIRKDPMQVAFWEGWRDRATSLRMSPGGEPLLNVALRL